jgi:ComF family protein
MDLAISAHYSIWVAKTDIPKKTCHFNNLENFRDNTVMKFLSQLIDIIYPPRCHICSRFLSPDERPHSSFHLCSRCLAGLTPITHPMCTVCGLPFPTSPGPDHLCENCFRKQPWYDFLRSPYLYSGPFMESIQRFKYNMETHLKSSLGHLLSSFAKEWIPNLKDFVIVPVPLHRRRLRERGFNQSLLLARILASDLGNQLDYLSLIRNRYTRAQTGLKKKERRKNVKDAFSIIHPDAIKDKKILLVDDVFTTGYTLNECARTLKKSGATTVICLTMARTLVN